jgi:hypothetical protein
MGTSRLGDPGSRHDLAPLPDPLGQIQLSELQEVAAAEAESATGLGLAER